MAPPISNTSAEPTLYDILALTPKHLEGQAGAAQQQKIVKQAYHRALLKHHPDKAASGPPASSPSPSAPSASSPNPPSGSKSKPSPKTHTKQGSHSQPRIAYTVDQIQHAYAVLSDAKQRREYDRLLRASPARRHQQTQSFQTGVETVDLDDVSFDERTGVYYRSCRCGNARGYAFTEENLEEFEEDGVLMVECLDCSLWVRVLFAAAEDEEPAAANVATVVNSGGSRGPRDDAVAPRGEDIAVTTSGEQRGAGTGRGFTFNWSFNWGISLSGTAASSSATIETGSSSRR